MFDEARAETSIREPQSIAIVGGGVGGLASLRELVKAYRQNKSTSLPPLEITWFDRTDSFGIGTAFTAEDPVFRMQYAESIDAADKEHFQNWLARTPAYAAYVALGPAEIPRAVYGAYLRAAWLETEAMIAAHNCTSPLARRIRYTRKVANVETIDPPARETPEDGFLLEYAVSNGSTLNGSALKGSARHAELFDQVVLATGHTPHPLWRKAPTDGAIAHRADDPRQLDRVLTAPDVAIIGVSAAALDALRYLQKKNYRGRVTLVAPTLYEESARVLAKKIHARSRFLGGFLQKIRATGAGFELEIRGRDEEGDTGEWITLQASAVINAAPWHDRAYLKADGTWAHPDPLLNQLMIRRALVANNHSRTGSLRAQLVVSNRPGIAGRLHALGPSFGSDSVSGHVGQASRIATAMMMNLMGEAPPAPAPRPRPVKSAANALGLK